MKKLAVAAVCTLSLSGCAMPVGVTVATWAADGWSLLATNKSIMDHGISYIAGEDCAMWRLFTEDEICRPEQTDTIVVDAGDAGNGSLVPQGYAGTYSDDALADFRTLTQGGAITTEADDQTPQSSGGPVVIAALGDGTDYGSRLGQPWYRQNRNAEYLSLMPESFLDGQPKASPVAISTVASAAPSVPAVPVAPVTASDQTLIASGHAPAPAIDIDFGAAPAPEAAPTVVAERPAIRTVGAFNAAPGHYLVVGSFVVQANADRFATRHRALAAHVHQASVDGATVYRVVIGPYLDSERQHLETLVSEAGIESTWKLNVSDGATVAAWLPYVASEVASIAAVPES